MGLLLWTFRLPFRITWKPLFCDFNLGHGSYSPNAKSPAGADPVRAWRATTHCLDRAPPPFYSASPEWTLVQHTPRSGQGTESRNSTSPPGYSHCRATDRNPFPRMGSSQLFS